jgi:apolipoprotein N-acyltransferase
LGKAVLVAALSAGAFHLAFGYASWSWLVLVFLGGLFALRRLGTPRKAFYTGLAVGLGIYGPQLSFFWRIFGPAAIVLWLVLAFWLAVFVLVLHHVQRRWGTKWAVVLAPVVWLGLEFFRSELYYLRFAWFTAGSVLPVSVSQPLLAWLGVYGCGALLMVVAATMTCPLEDSSQYQQPAFIRQVILAVVGCCLLVGFLFVHATITFATSGPVTRIPIAGLQLEFAGPTEILEHLRQVTKEYPKAELMVLSEYAFDGPVPDNVKHWCRQNRRWLIAGGKEPLANGNFYDTAYVVNTNGDVVFQQVKAVPVQMFKDGLPAPEQRVWDSPWGKIGLCICYDLNYSRVVDRLIRQGARALIVPTMDLESWGLYEHQLAARLTAIRSAEYGLPILRLASSGISQLVDEDGELVAQTSVPGAGEVMAGDLAWRGFSRPHLPLDRYLAPVCVAATVVLISALFFLHWRDRRQNRATPNPELPASP